MRVFKQKYVCRRTGEMREASRWYVAFSDHRGQERRIPGFTDRQSTEQLGRKLDALSGAVGTRQMIGPELAAWLDGLQASTRRHLSKMGLIDSRVSSLSNPLEDHLRDWHGSLIAKDRTDAHAALQRARVLAMAKGCGWTHWVDLNVGDAERWLHRQRSSGSMSTRTSNHHVVAARSFCGWMVEDGRSAASPLSRLRPVPVTDEIKHGVFTVDQVAKLVRHCDQEAADVWGTHQRTPAQRPRRRDLERFMDGPDRAFLYRFAVETALRAGAIQTLTVEQIKFDRDEHGQVVGGVIRTKVGQQKNRKPHDVPLRVSFAAELASRFRDMAPGVKPFGRVPTHAARMLRNDLLNAGLPLVDEDGLPLRFHSFRCTCATWLGEAGLGATEIAAVTGHLTRSMVDHYTHASKRAGRRAIEHLPVLRVTA